MTGKMFPFITDTWNPMKGCTHNCSYCWAKAFSKRIYKDGFALHLFPERLKYTKKNQFVFVCDMGDLFCDGVPDAWIEQVLDAVRVADKSNKFLFLTKNPKRYNGFSFPTNCILGATIETNRDIPKEISMAPLPRDRFIQKVSISTFICVEPIMDFDPNLFIQFLHGHSAVAIGYDNYNNGLPEPPLEKTNALIAELRSRGIKVYTKTLREANK